MRDDCPLLMSWIVTPSCYRLRVGTSMVTTTAARTKTTTTASASKDPIALISVRSAMFLYVKVIRRAVPCGKSHRRPPLRASASAHPPLNFGSLWSHWKTRGPRDRAS